MAVPAKVQVRVSTATFLRGIEENRRFARHVTSDDAPTVAICAASVTVLWSERHDIRCLMSRRHFPNGERMRLRNRTCGIGPSDRRPFSPRRT